MGWATYKQPETVQAGENGKVGGGSEPDLDVEDAAAHLGPLESLLAFRDGTARVSIGSANHGSAVRVLEPFRARRLRTPLQTQQSELLLLIGEVRRGGNACREEQVGHRSGEDGLFLSAHPLHRSADFSHANSP
jgi:hydroxyacyl-ACP dehydratase HTD2-like protein with hotdog domain